MQKNKKNYKINKIHSERLPATILSEKKIFNWEALTDHLCDSAQLLDICGARVATAISADLIRTDKFQISPDVSDKQIRRSLARYFNRQSEHAHDPSIFDFYRNEHHPQQLHVTSASQEYISKLVTCFQAASLSLSIIDLDIYAWVRYAIHSQDIDPLCKYGVLCANANPAIFMLFNSREITSYTYWDNLMSADLMGMVETHVIPYVTRMNAAPLKKCFILSELQPTIKQNAELGELIKVNACVDIANEDKNQYPLEHFYVAMGLAMRDCLPWLS